MITQQTYALLALEVYAAGREDNKPLLPPPWTKIPNQPVGTDGFAYAVYKNPATNEVVISYRGTDDDFGDWTTNFGLSISQEKQAAAVYQRVLSEHGSNISFTGHSLGGGLAATMAVWFNRPAVVFDPAPSETTARFLPDVVTVISSLGTGVPQAIIDYSSNVTAQFAARESNVTSYFVPGSIVHSFSTASNTITGAGQGNPVQFDTTNMLGFDASKELHSQALLTVGLLSDPFRASTVAVQRALPLVMDKRLYALPTSGSDRNFLLDLIRSEQQNVGNGKLTHFANDLNKLGTNITGLNDAAQKAIIAQGIEWYYWQTPAYAGQEFFIQTAGLLQYTSNQANDDSTNKSANKAVSYLNAWLTPLYNASGEFGGRVTFDQWSVAASSTGVTATARDASKSQIYIGGTGADTFTGGTLSDVILAGDGGDTLNGGAGYDRLYGGGGDDTYNFTASFGGDRILDADGLGSLWVDGVQLTGGKQLGDNVWESDGDIYRYTLMGGNLVIGRGSNAGTTMQGTITVQGWTTTASLGIVLDNASVPNPAAINTYNGDQRAPLNASGNYNWAATSWLPDGTLVGGVAEANFNDVIYGGALADELNGLGGNDALEGGAGNDKIDGGVGDDLIGGGAGSDTIKGGAGNDYIYSATGLSAPQRIKPADDWVAPVGTTVMIEGSTWGVYATANPITEVSTGAGSIAMDDAPDVIDAGEGDDHVIAGRGDDYIDGGLGIDSITGGGGNDIIDGGDGNDYLDGEGSTTPGLYNSVAAAIHGDDFMDGGEGNDQVRGQGGNDELFGGSGNDVLIGDDIDETYLNGAFHGNDYLDGDDGADTLVGGGKDDTLYGGAGDDIMEGDGSQNQLSGAYHGNDYMDGEDGNDTMAGGGKDDVLFGGAGNDIIWGDSVTDPTRGVEGAFHGNDYLDGEDGDDTLYGGGKDDILYGGTGNDALIGGDGADYMDGGEGNYGWRGSHKSRYHSSARQQRSCYKNYSAWCNGYEGYRPVFHKRKSNSSELIPSLVSRLPKVSRNEALQ